jgi:hypothetical protein
VAFFRCNDGTTCFTIFIGRAKVPERVIVNELRPASRSVFIITYWTGIFAWVVILGVFATRFIISIPVLAGEQGIAVLGVIDAMIVISVTGITNINFRGRGKA